MPKIARDKRDLAATGHSCHRVIGCKATARTVFANGSKVLRPGDPLLPHTILVCTPICFCKFHFFVIVPKNNNMTVNISSLPNNIKKVASNLAISGRLFQLDAGPISPNPGPILPIADAETDREVIRSDPKKAKIVAAKTRQFKNSARFA